MRATLTIFIWIAVITAVSGAAAIAVLFATMATSLDPTQVISAGLEPWWDAGLAALAAVGALVVGALALRLWHSRFAPVGAVLACAEIAGLVWACAWIYGEFF